jgi:hypothetical protein
MVVLANSVKDDHEPVFPGQAIGSVCIRPDGFDEARERLAEVPGLRLVSAP